MNHARPVGWLGRTRRRLSEERKLLDVLLDSLDVAVVACGPEGQLTRLNRRAVELMGMDGSTGSDPATWTERVLPRTAQGLPLSFEELPIVRALRGDVARGVDMLVRTRGGGDALMSTTANPVYNDKGIQIGAVAVFTDVTEQRARQAEMRDELQAANLAVGIEEAIAAGDLVLYAQPVIDLATGETVLEELLLRVRTRDGTFVSPCRFLEIAERYGTVTRVDEWVFLQAVQVATAGRPVNVNVSARTIGRSSFLDLVETTLAHDGVEPYLITFEITETTVISDIVAAVRFTDRLEAIGCQFALDDFGTGYAPLTYLKHLPVRYLKIDMEFVRDLVESARSRGVVSSIVGIAAGLGQRTIAEGVEDSATLALLRELGVDLAQGFHIAKPAPIARMAPSPAPVLAKSGS
jgi:EAL domain-containing protein (putative c-di-GMP-specific phosphodiesterase class I)